MPTPVDPYNPGRPPLVKTTVWIILAVAVAWALTDIAGAAGLAVMVLSAGVLVLLASWWWVYRRWQIHDELPALLRKNLTGVLRSDLPPGTLVTSGHSFGTFLKPGPPKKVKIAATGLPPLEGDIAQRVISITSDIASNAFVVDKKKSKPGKKIVLRQKPKEKAENLTPRQVIERGITQAVRELFPKHEPKIALAWDEEKPDEDYLMEVNITAVAGMELAMPGKRRQILQKLRTRLPRGNFKSDVDPTEDAIYFHRSKPLPPVVVPPKEHAPLLVDHKAYSKFSVPLGVGDNNVQAVWHPNDDAHLLIIGGTGGGKTIAEHGVIQRLTQAGWRTWLVDGKRIEFIGYRDWPNVELLAQKIDHQIRVLKLAHETMEARYDLIERGEVLVEDLDPIAIVVDELTYLLKSIKRRYQETKVKGMPAQPPVLGWMAEIAGLGRSAKMHLVEGLQRPDADIMGGEMRDNFGGRISLSKLQSKEASMMMWDDPAIGVSVPNIKGRAVSTVNGQLGMVQGTYTANPDPNARDYHAGMVEAMRPHVEIYSRKTIADPDPEIPEKADEEPIVTWNSIIEAPLLGADGNPVRFDPVSSEESKKLRREHTAGETTEENSQLQAAESFAAALDLFTYDPLEKLSISPRMVRRLAALAEQMHAQYGAAEDTGVEAPGPQKISNTISVNLEKTSTTELRYIEPGQNIIVDEIGGEELTVAACEPDSEDPQTYYLTGYTAAGESVHVELPADTTVDTFDRETEYADA